MTLNYNADPKRWVDRRGGPLVVRSRAPLRLGFGGGGTDLSPYCDQYGGCVLNASISLYAYCTISLRSDSEVSFVSADRNQHYHAAADQDHTADGDLILHAGVYNRIIRQFLDGRPLPVTITTQSDVPPGSGLGSSSTMVVSMVKAFTELLGLPLGEYEIAHLAYEIERVDLGLRGGRQDQYAATFGGFNFIEFFSGDRVIVNPLRVKNWIISELESSLVLVYTGISRSSAAIIDQQTRNLETSDDDCIEAMHAMKQQTLRMKEALLRGELNMFAACMGEGWLSKKRTASGISNGSIDCMYEVAIASGAHAGKLSGAGGGGFMMFLVDPLRRLDVTRALESANGRIVPCRFQKYGTEGWRI
jgi:D-glycero-alpha-D-manno-heptose-7-phosphate kinase